ncbi:MAG: hypothetical protein AAF804_04710, partial [Bacteroidota bacterium]
MKPVTLLFRQTLHRIWRAAGTKYVLVLLAASIYIIFFDRYNLRSQADIVRFTLAIAAFDGISLQPPKPTNSPTLVLTPEALESEFHKP